jgi:hypothetical protein
VASDKLQNLQNFKVMSAKLNKGNGKPKAIAENSQSCEISNDDLNVLRNALTLIRDQTANIKALKAANRMQQKRIEDHLREIDELNERVEALKTPGRVKQPLQAAASYDCVNCIRNNNCPFKHCPTGYESSLCQAMANIHKGEVAREAAPKIYIKGETFAVKPASHFAKLINSTN